MNKLLLTITLLSLYTFSSAQIKNVSLDNISSIAQAKNFIEANPKSEAKLFTIQEGMDTSEILLPLYNKNPGFTFHIDNNAYKILNVDSTLSFRVSYIFISGDSFSKQQIDTLRQQIISKYNEGTSFTDLTMQYNMDGNITGDTRWFTENMMVKEFEDAVKIHKKGDIFTVDEPAQNWYHVVLKT